MGCKTCNGSNHVYEDSELTKAMKLAKIEADAENRTYVVVENEGVYYPECLDCRNKSGIHHGNIVAYIR